MALLVVPVTGGHGGPGRRRPCGWWRSATRGRGAELLAAAVAGLAVGLLPYSAFLLLARGYYALGDSRTPGVVSLVAAPRGVVVMAVGRVTVDGAARIAVLGLGHSLGLHRRRRGPGRGPDPPHRGVAAAGGAGRIGVVSAVAGVAGGRQRGGARRGSRAPGGSWAT